MAIQQEGLEGLRTQPFPEINPVRRLFGRLHHHRRPTTSLAPIAGVAQVVNMSKRYKVSDPSLAKKLLGWEAKVSLEDGLKRTFDWYLAQKFATDAQIRAAS